MKTRLLVILAFLFFQIGNTFIISSLNVTCIEKERQSLLAFKQTLRDKSNRLSTWRGVECCEWKGVECDRRNGHVVKLDLGYHHGSLNDPLYNDKWLKAMDLLGYIGLEDDDDVVQGQETLKADEPHPVEAGSQHRYEDFVVTIGETIVAGKDIGGATNKLVDLEEDKSKERAAKKAKADSRKRKAEGGEDKEAKKSRPKHTASRSKESTSAAETAEEDSAFKLIDEDVISPHAQRISPTVDMDVDCGASGGKGKATFDPATAIEHPILRPMGGFTAGGLGKLSQMKKDLSRGNISTERPTVEASDDEPASKMDEDTRGHIFYPNWGLKNESKFDSVELCREFARLSIPPGEVAELELDDHAEARRKAYVKLTMAYASGVNMISRNARLESSLVKVKARSEERRQGLREAKTKLTEYEDQIKVLTAEGEKAASAMTRVADVERELEVLKKEKAEASASCTEMSKSLEESRLVVTDLRKGRQEDAAAIAGLEAEVAKLKEEKEKISNSYAGERRLSKQLGDDRQWLIEEGFNWVMAKLPKSKEYRLPLGAFQKAVAARASHLGFVEGYEMGRQGKPKEESKRYDPNSGRLLKRAAEVYSGIQYPYFDDLAKCTNKTLEDLRRVMPDQHLPAETEGGSESQAEGGPTSITSRDAVL